MPQDTTEYSADSGGLQRLASCAPAASAGKRLFAGCTLGLRGLLLGWVPLWPHLREPSGFSRVLPQPPSVLWFHVYSLRVLGSLGFSWVLS